MVDVVADDTHTAGPLEQARAPRENRVSLAKPRRGNMENNSLLAEVCVGHIVSQTRTPAKIQPLGLISEDRYCGDGVRPALRSFVPRYSPLPSTSRSYGLLAFLMRRRVLVASCDFPNWERNRRQTSAFSVCIKTSMQSCKRRNGDVHVVLVPCHLDTCFECNAWCL